MVNKITSPITPLGEIDKINEVIDQVNTNTTGIASKQATLVSGTNIKTINNKSLLGPGNITISGGTATTVKINGTSITSNNVADIKTNGTYNATSNKIATMADVQNIHRERNIGEIVTSTIPLTDAGLHLLDGALISGSGIYSDFVTYISGLVSNYPDLFISESDWQTSVTNYGVCGKFVYDSTNNTVRLPKITGIVEGTTDVTALGDLVEAGLPNITGWIRFNGIDPAASSGSSSGAFTKTNASGAGNGHDAGTSNATVKFNFNASLSSPIYGNSTTVQPQTIKVLYYIVVATSAKTDIQVDIDNIATDLNGKADRDGSNMVSSVKNFDGQWVSSFLRIANGVTWKTNTAEATYSLANYLPNDNYNYEVLFVGTAGTGSTSGNFVTIGLNSDLIDNGEVIAICEARTRTASTMSNRGNAIIPIGTGRYIKQYSSSSSNANGTYSLWALAYRRIGTNS